MISSIRVLIIAILWFLNQDCLALSDDFPFAHAIFSCDNSLWFEDLLDDMACLGLEFVLGFFNLGRLNLRGVLNLSQDLGLFLLSGLTTRLLIDLSLTLSDFRELVCESLVRGFRSLLFWRLRIRLRFVPKLALSNLFLYGFGLHLLLGVFVFFAIFFLALVIIIVVFIFLSCLLASLCSSLFLQFFLLLCSCRFHLFRLLLLNLLSLFCILCFLNSILLNLFLLLFFGLFKLLLLLLSNFFSLLLQICLICTC